MGGTVLLGLYASSLYNFLLFHSLVEIFSVIVSFVIFVLAWNTRRVQDNHYLLFLGIAFLFTGALEMVHAFAYKGFGVFPAHDANLPTQLWIAFRYLLSISFLAAPFFISRTLNVVTIFAIYAAVTSLLFWSIFSGVFPDCFVEGRGLTPFKIISEYVIIFVFLASLGLLIRNRNAIDRRVLRLMVFSILSATASELSFTRYVSVFGFANMAGHLFLLASVYFIYRAIVVTGVVEPSRLLFRNLKLSEEALQKAHDMLEQRVRERTEELARTNEELEAEIAERMRAEGEVRQLNRELEQRVIDRTAQLEAANKELEAFAYSVSHDLRAPLRSIEGFTRAIEEEQAARLDDTGKDYFRRVREAARRMTQLIDALLDLSRLTRGDLNRFPVDMSALAKGVAEELPKARPGRKAEFVIADGLTALGDPVMLRAVVANLLENAWKFTGKRESTRIEFGETRKDGKTVYFVRDNGDGFDMTYADRLFKAFQRLHSNEEFPGLGIGLATVQRIVHRHGGSIWAEGETGKGATVYFTL
jgi:signal transduction histidine kinase